MVVLIFCIKYFDERYDNAWAVVSLLCCSVSAEKELIKQNVGYAMQEDRRDTE